MHHTHHPRVLSSSGSGSGSRSGSLGLVATTILAAAGVASSAHAGEIVPPPGGTVHSWTGLSGSSWSLPGNWNTLQVPADGDSAVILGGVIVNASLFQNTADLESLFVGAGRSLSNNTHRLRVSSSLGSETTLTGASSLSITPRPDGTVGFDARVVEVNSDSRLRMFGGRAEVLTLDLASGGRIEGHGRIDVLGGGFSALDGVGAGTLEISGGDLQIFMVNDGGMAIPGDIVFADADRTLELRGPLSVPLGNIDLGQGGTLDVTEPWTLGGTLDADSDPGEAARITGAAMTVQGDIDVNAAGRLEIESPVHFQASGTTTIGGAGGTLEIATDAASAEPGHLTAIAIGGRLLMSETPGGPWSGDIDVARNGTLELSDASGMWIVEGDLQLNGFVTQRSRLAGPGRLLAGGRVEVNGSGGEIDGFLDLGAGAVMDFELPSSSLLVDGTLRLRDGSDTIGDGTIAVRSTGSLQLLEGASLTGDLTNAGVVQLGLSVAPGYAIIDGSFAQSAAGELQIDMFGPTNFDRDILEASDGAQVNGELRIELRDGYLPEIGDTFSVVQTSGSVTGSFVVVSGTPGFEVSYTAQQVIVTYVGESTCLGDITGDGVADLADLLVVLAEWGPCKGCDGDLDADGVVGISDLLAVLAAWGSCG